MIGFSLPIIGCLDIKKGTTLIMSNFLDICKTKRFWIYTLLTFALASFVTFGAQALIGNFSFPVYIALGLGTGYILLDIGALNSESWLKSALKGLIVALGFWVFTKLSLILGLVSGH